MRKQFYTAIIAFGLVFGVFSAAAEAVDTEMPAIFIGTGDSTGVYYPTGCAIARIVNERQDTLGIKVTAEVTGASLFNINALLAGDLQFGMAQADLLYQAYNGLGEWEGRPQKDLRAIFALAPEMVTFVAAEDSGITSIAHVKGKAINIGNPGSGNRQNAIDILESAGINYENDIMAANFKAADAPRKLQEGVIDGFFYTVGHPNRNIREATIGRRAVRIVRMDNIDALAAKFPYYVLSEIDLTHYPKAVNAAEARVPAISMVAIFVTSSKMSDEVVYTMTKGVLENLEALKALHPALAMLTTETMLKGLTAPIHPGAMRYYRESGFKVR